MQRRDAVRSLVFALPVLLSLQPTTSSASVDRMAVRLGRAVIREHPGIVSGGADVFGLPADRAELGMRIRQDFASGRVLLVQGWCLSRTEARVCALAALTVDDR